MSETPKTFAEARKAAEERLLGDGPAEAHEERGTEAAEHAADPPAPRKEESAQKTEAKKEALPPKQDVVTIKLPDGGELEMTAAEQQRLIQLGMEVGDEGSVKTARQLEQFAQRNPEAARALDKIMGTVVADPEKLNAVLEQLGVVETEEVESEDPRDARIRELEQQLAKSKGEPKGKSAQEVLKEKVQAAKNAYPALQTYTDDELAERIELRLLKGQTAQQAITELLRSGISRATRQAESKAEAARKQRGLRPNAGDGSPATSVSEPPQRTADDLVSGRVMKDVLSRQRP